MDINIESVLLAAATVISTIVGIIAVIANLLQFLKSGIFERKELEPIVKERQEINERIKETKERNTVDSIQLSLNQLTEYYVINKSQARNSFRSSIIFISFGFVIIALGIGNFYVNPQSNLLLTAISSISGVILQFIGGTSFVVYRKSLEQLNYFFDQLVKMQDTMLALQLIKELPEQEQQGRLMETMIITLLERSSGIKMPRNEVMKTISLNGSNSHPQPNNLESLISPKKAEE